MHWLHIRMPWSKQPSRLEGSMMRASCRGKTTGFRGEERNQKQRDCTELCSHALVPLRRYCALQPHSLSNTNIFICEGHCKQNGSPLAKKSVHNVKLYLYKYFSLSLSLSLSRSPADTQLETYEAAWRAKAVCRPSRLQNVTDFPPLFILLLYLAFSSHQTTSYMFRVMTYAGLLYGPVIPLLQQKLI